MRTLLAVILGLLFAAGDASIASQLRASFQAISVASGVHGGQARTLNGARGETGYFWKHVNMDCDAAGLLLLQLAFDGVLDLVVVHEALHFFHDFAVARDEEAGGIPEQAAKLVRNRV